ncbi:MAG: glycosyltransferase [Anaerovoracaceae bacterium]|jgi:glycosyltransferase involved in cell wall biosynthesis
MKILFIRSNKAFLPEISAYINYFNKTKEFQAYDTSELSEGYDIRDFDIIWEFKGIGGCNAKDKIMVHEYASLSTGNFPKAKNILKKYINLRPNLRLFLNNYVRKGYNFQDGVDFCYRDMGISEIFFGQMDDAKEYEFVYIGSVSKSREIDKLLKAFTKKENRKICLIGNVEDDIYKQYKKNKNITFTGKIPYSEVPSIASKGIYGINYIPNRYPYYLQTSTKLLEYLALGLKVITTDYQWVNEFEKKNQCSFYKLDYNNISLDFNSIEKFNYKSQIQTEDYLWDNVINKSKVKDKLLQIYIGRSE